MTQALPHAAILRARAHLADLIDRGDQADADDLAAIDTIERLIAELEAVAIRDSLARYSIATRGTALADTGERWRLVAGDALELLRQIPDESIDGLFTDPPYSSGGQFRGDRNAQPSEKYQTSLSSLQGAFPEIIGDNRDQRSYFAWCALWLAECRRALRPGAPFGVFCDWRQLGTMQDAVQAGGLVMRGVAPWIKPVTRPNAGRLRQDAEFIVWGTNGPAPIDFTRPVITGHWLIPVRSKREHMTEKPVEVMRDLVKMAADGGLILDPFAGAATTGVGALLEGRRFLGMELAPEYVEVGRRWLASTVAGADRFAVASGQGSLFGGDA